MPEDLVELTTIAQFKTEVEAITFVSSHEVIYWIRIFTPSHSIRFMDLEQLANDVLFECWLYLREKKSNLGASHLRRICRCITKRRTLDTISAMNCFKRKGVTFPNGDLPNLREGRQRSCEKVSDAVQFQEVVDLLTNSLAPEEMKIICWRMEGWVTVDIAAKLGISSRSVNRKILAIGNHVRSIAGIANVLDLPTRNKEQGTRNKDQGMSNFI